MTRVCIRCDERWGTIFIAYLDIHAVQRAYIYAGTRQSDVCTSRLPGDSEVATDLSGSDLPASFELQARVTIKDNVHLR